MKKVEEDSPQKFDEYTEFIKYLREKSQLKGSAGLMAIKLYSTLLSEVSLLRHNSFNYFEICVNRNQRREVQSL